MIRFELAFYIKPSYWLLGIQAGWNYLDLRVGPLAISFTALAPWET